MSDQLFKTVPFAHQAEALRRSRDRETYALFMEQGTGKSKVVVDTITWLYSQGAIDGVLIIAPKSVCLTWQRNELPAHLPDVVAEQTAVIVGSPGMYARVRSLKDVFGQYNPAKLEILIMNIDALTTPRGTEVARHFLLEHSALMVIDESTTIKNPSAKRTKTALKLGKLAKYRRVLTGTPVTNSPLDLYSQLAFLDDDILGCGSYYSFRNHYAIMQQRHLSDRAFNHVVGYKNLHELQGLLAPHSYRCTKAECLDLPPKLFTRRYVELTDEQRRVYDRLKDAAFAELKSEQGTTVVSTMLVITKLLRLHQVVSGWILDDLGIGHQLADPPPKLTALLELLDELPPTAKVLIWATYTHDITLITGKLTEVYGPGTTAPFYGAVSQEDRQETVRQFQDPNSPLRFFVGQPQTGGRGLTLTAATTVVYYSNSYDLELRLQSEDRAHRIGQEHPVTYVDIVAKDTVDEKIVNALRAKKNLAREVTGDNLEDWL